MECQMRVNDVFCAVSLGGSRKTVGDLLDAEALGCHLFNGEKFLRRADHARGENACQLLRFETNDAVVHGETGSQKSSM